MEKVIELLSNPAVIAVVTMLIEAVLRLVKTDKPRSILHLIAGIVRKVADISKLLADFLDKVLPQKLSEPVTPIPLEKK